MATFLANEINSTEGDNGPNGACPNYVSFKGLKKCRVFEDNLSGT